MIGVKTKPKPRAKAKKPPAAKPAAKKPRAKKSATAAKKSPPTAAKQGRSHPAVAAVRAIALAYPEAHEDFPWGERVIKVKGKIFLFMGTEAGALYVGVKLPSSGQVALMLPFTEPSHYGMGKYGWVSATFAAGAAVPIEMIRDWIDESYRSIAPKKLVAGLRS